MQLNKYPMLNTLVNNVKELAVATHVPVPNDREIVEGIGRKFDLMGPYKFATLYHLLVDNSGEEFAIQFMSAYNELHPGTY